MVTKQIPIHKNVMAALYVIIILVLIIKIAICGYEFGQWLKVR
jgi:hypothetical protein